MSNLKDIRRTRTLLLLAAIGALVAAAVLLAGPSDAAPDSQVVNYADYNAGRICAVLDAYPTLPGVDGVLEGIANDTGFAARDVVRILVLAVTNDCPRHVSLLKRYAYTIGPGQTAAVI